MSAVLSLLRKRRAGEHRDDTQSRQHDLRIEQIYFGSPHRVAPCGYLLGIRRCIRTVLRLLNHDFFNYKSSHQREYLGALESAYATCSMPKSSAIKILFQANGLLSALIASALWVALKFALRESHCSSSHLRGNKSARRRQRVDRLRLPTSAYGTKRTFSCRSAMSAFGVERTLVYRALPCGFLGRSSSGCRTASEGDAILTDHDPTRDA